MKDSGKWLRPLTMGEYFMYELNKEGICLISYVLRVSTSRPLTEDDGKKVFTSLLRFVDKSSNIYSDVNPNVKPGPVVKQDQFYH